MIRIFENMKYENGIPQDYYYYYSHSLLRDKYDLYGP